MHAHWKIPFACISSEKTQRCSPLKPSVFSLLGRCVHVKQNKVPQHPSEPAAAEAEQSLGSAPCSLPMLPNSFPSSVDRMSQWSKSAAAAEPN